MSLTCPPGILKGMNLKKAYHQRMCYRTTVREEVHGALGTAVVYTYRYIVNLIKLNVSLII